MEAPLTARPTFGEEDSRGSPAQPLPQELRDQLRRLLHQPPQSPSSAVGRAPAAGGEAARLRKQARKVIIIVVVDGWCWAYTMSRAFYIESTLQEPAIYVAGFALPGLIFMCGFVTPFLVGRACREMLPDMLEGLNRPVGDKFTREMAKFVTRAHVLRVFMVAVSGITSLVAAVESLSLNVESNAFVAFQWAAAIVPVLLAPAFGEVLTVWTIGQNLSFMLAEDKVSQLVTEVLRATAGTADFTALTTGVYRAHTDTARLSRMMQSQLLITTAMYFMLVVVWLYMAVGPRPDKGHKWYGAGSWYNFFFNEYLCVVMSTIWAGMGVYILMAPAKVTSACQRVADAVNDLRVTAKADGTAELATADELHRIEGLKRYINELNKDQGLGFLLLRKKITFTFV
jgi:hypothetical protein